MKDAVLLLVSGLLAAGSAALTATLVGTADASSPDGSEIVTPGLSATDERIARLLERQDELERFLAAQTPADAAPSAEARPDLVREAVQAWLEANAGALAAGAGASPDEVLVAGDPAVASMRGAPLGELIDLIRDDSLSGADRERAWRRLAEAGRLDEVVAELERLVEQEPQDPDLRVTLGNAYLQQLFQGSSGPRAGELAGAADAAFDAALRLDETHWEARFTKAVSLSNWPAFLGKQGEAIEEFERLVTQQEQQTAQSGHEQTYLFLGNMYLETGETDKALSTWRNGLERFPASEALREQIQRNGGGGR